MKYFSITELVESQTGRRHNVREQFGPPKSVTDSLQKLVDNILDPLREKYGKPIKISSGYRSPRVNSIVGGAKNSQHLIGEAADIQAIDGNNAALFNLIKEMKLPFDQLIWEYGTTENPAWVHVSFGSRNRRQILFVPKNLKTNENS